MSSETLTKLFFRNCRRQLPTKQRLLAKHLAKHLVKPVYCFGFIYGWVVWGNSFGPILIVSPQSPTIRRLLPS